MVNNTNNQLSSQITFKRVYGISVHFVWFYNNIIFYTLNTKMKQSQMKTKSKKKKKKTVANKQTMKKHKNPQIYRHKQHS